MANSQKKDTQAPGEKELGNADSQESKEDEIKTEIIEKFGLDEEENADLIESLVQDKIEERKQLSTAIKQKVAYREKLKAQESSGQEEEEQKKEKKSQTTTDEDGLLEKLKITIKQELEERDLKSFDLEDEIKAEVRDYAKLKNITYAEALKSDYIQFRKQALETLKREEKASASSKGKAFGMAQRDFSQMSPNDFDLTTKEGREEFEEYKKFKKG